jgi:SAM-dependent methyltransferase
LKEEEIKKAVRDNYAKIAINSSCCCSSDLVSCCEQPGIEKRSISKIGYTNKDMEKARGCSNLILGCGNPVALASIKKNEVVLDLGSGAGFDCFLAADKVGPGGKVIGMDMTVQMIEKARENAKKGGYKNVEFRLGEIEYLSVEDSSVNLIISNCVVNISPDKDKVFKEAYRVLKPGGRLIISDIVLIKELPDYIKNNISAYVSCISGAIIKDIYLRKIEQAGFIDIKVLDEVNFPINFTNNKPDAVNQDFEKSILSIRVSAIKEVNKKWKNNN